MSGWHRLPIGWANYTRANYSRISYPGRRNKNNWVNCWSRKPISGQLNSVINEEQATGTINRILIKIIDQEEKNILV